MTDRERDLMKGLCSFGWAIVDPWDYSRERLSVGVWTVTDAGPTCPVCGEAAPDMGERWPTGDTFEDPRNHADDCPLAELLAEDGP